tara:strand:+ start:149 stop:412 length:264 start_codon:yes stop_codon:yes gene_type:complete
MQAAAATLLPHTFHIHTTTLLFRLVAHEQSHANPQKWRAEEEREGGRRTGIGLVAIAMTLLSPLPSLRTTKNRAAHGRMRQHCCRLL